MTSIHEDLVEALKTIKTEVPFIVNSLKYRNSEAINAWLRVVDKKLIPKFSPDFPLVAAICGGGSSGKSTLFNTLAKERISICGGRAGMNRRVLIAAHSSH